MTRKGEKINSRVLGILLPIVFENKDVALILEPI